MLSGCMYISKVHPLRAVQAANITMNECDPQTLSRCSGAAQFAAVIDKKLSRVYTSCEQFPISGISRAVYLR